MRPPYKIQSVDTLAEIFLLSKRDHLTIEEIAEKTGLSYYSINSILKTMTRHYEHPETVRAVSFNRNHTLAAQKVREILGEQLFQPMPAPSPRPIAPGGTSLTVEELVKIMWLRKKHDQPISEIARQVGRGLSAVWACLDIVEKRYWNADPKTITRPNTAYLQAVLLTKELLVTNQDPFTIDLASRVKNANEQPVPEQQVELPLLTDTPEHTETLPTDPYVQFEKELGSAVTKLVSAIVEEKLAVERSHLTADAQKRALLEEQVQKLTSENQDLTRRNDELVRKLLQHKQTSLASSLKSSFGTE